MHAPNPNPQHSDAPTLTNLTPQQVQAATLLAAGQSYSEVSQTLSVGRTTLYRWRQFPEFAAYLNILIKQAADETLLQAICLLTTAPKLVKQRLEDPNTSPAEQARLALRLLSVCSKPAFLKFLSAREDDPIEVTRVQMLDEILTDESKDFPDSIRAIFLAGKHEQVRKAEAFDTQYPVCSSGASRGIPERAATSLADLTAQLPKRTKVEHNGTAAHRSMALGAAISGVLPQLAAAY